MLADVSQQYMACFPLLQVSLFLDSPVFLLSVFTLKCEPYFSPQAATNIRPGADDREAKQVMGDGMENFGKCFVKYFSN